MNQHQDRTPVRSLADLDIVGLQLSERILSTASTGTRSIRETYIHRYSHSHAKFAAACELAESYGVAVH